MNCLKMMDVKEQRKHFLGILQPPFRLAYLAVTHCIETSLVLRHQRRQLDTLVAAPASVGAGGLLLETLAIDDAPVLHEFNEQRLPLRRFGGIRDHQRIAAAIDPQIAAK